MPVILPASRTDSERIIEVFYLLQWW